MGPESLSLAVGETKTIQLSALYDGEDVTNKLDWIATETFVPDNIGVSAYRSVWSPDLARNVWEVDIRGNIEGVENYVVAWRKPETTGTESDVFAKVTIAVTVTE